MKFTPRPPINLAPQSAVVTIQYVGESKTRVVNGQQPEGRQRWVIGAVKTTGETLDERNLGLTTLDAWKALLCVQARDKQFPVAIKFRETGYFDRDLLWVGLIKEGEEGATA